MAVIQRLAARVLETAEAAGRSDEAPEAAASRITESLDSFVGDYREAGRSIVQHAGRELIPDAGWVASFSRSSLVERTLLAAHQAGRDIQVLLGESRPLYEGRELSTRLTAAGVQCWLTVDAACGLLLPRADVLIVGADAVRPRTFVNKVGTYSLLLIARELNLDCYALAQREKFLPADAALFALDERQPSEVWADPTPGVQVRNPTFEEIPLGLLRGVMTEGGLLPPGEAGARAAEVSLPSALKIEWGGLGDEV
jgi:translation initiation factor eIF-2B subunit delta